MINVLVTTTSFQDTPGEHHVLMKAQGWTLKVLRGPLTEKKLLPIIDKYDAVICGDDEYTEAVLEKGKKGKLKAVSKYGVGLDKIDLLAAKKLGISVRNCPAVNPPSVSEHVIALLLSFSRNISTHVHDIKKTTWNRITGTEIKGKTFGIIGLGAIGQELSPKLHGLGLKVLAFDVNPNRIFINEHKYVELADSIEHIFTNSDIISLHVPLNKHTKHIINENVIFKALKKKPIIINTARGELVDSYQIIKGIKQGKVKAYLTDVLKEEPLSENEPLLGCENVIITPHVGSRTFESVQRQGTMAVKNLMELAEKWI
jgi:D-3-phosphoglycerate dehydrogenase / 2-oxoglutarate reductase